MHERVDILNNFDTYMESLLTKMEDLIRALKDKLSVSEKQALSILLDY